MTLIDASFFVPHYTIALQDLLRGTCQDNPNPFGVRIITQAPVAVRRPSDAVRHPSARQKKAKPAEDAPAAPGVAEQIPARNSKSRELKSQLHQGKDFRIECHWQEARPKATIRCRTAACTISFIAHSAITSSIVTFSCVPCHTLTHSDTLTRNHHPRKTCKAVWSHRSDATWQHLIALSNAVASWHLQQTLALLLYYFLRACLAWYDSSGI